MKLPRFYHLALGVSVTLGAAFIAATQAHANLDLLYATRNAAIHATAFNGDPEQMPPDFNPIMKSWTGSGTISGAMMDSVYAPGYPEDYGVASTAAASLHYATTVAQNQVAVQTTSFVSALAGAPLGMASASASFFLSAAWEITRPTTYQLTFNASLGYADFFTGTPGGLQLSLEGKNGPHQLTGVLNPGTYYLALGFLSAIQNGATESPYAFNLTLEESSASVPDPSSSLFCLMAGMAAIAAVRRRFAI